MAKASLNRWQAIGNVGRVDPHVSASGNTFVRFSLAVNERVKSDGEWTQKTEWFNLVIFGNQAEAFKKLVTKGAMLYVEARLGNDRYEKDGETRYSTSIIVDNFQVLKYGKDSEGESEPADEIDEEAYTEERPF